MLDQGSRFYSKESSGRLLAGFLTHSVYQQGPQAELLASCLTPPSESPMRRELPVSCLDQGDLPYPIRTAAQWLTHRHILPRPIGLHEFGNLICMQQTSLGTWVGTFSVKSSLPLPHRGAAQPATCNCGLVCSAFCSHRCFLFSITV